MSAVDEAAERIRASILAGEHPPGTPLRQDAMARELGVSKIPFREALQQLNGQGLVTARSNRGVSVRSLDGQEAEEIFSLRLSLEPLLLTRAIETHTIVDLAEAQLALGSTDLPPSVLNWRFHQALYRPAGWSRSLAIVESLHVSVAPYLTYYMEDLEGAAVADAEHAELLDHYRNHRTANALRVLRSHLTNASSTLTKQLTPTKADQIT